MDSRELERLVRDLDEREIEELEAMLTRERNTRETKALRGLQASFLVPR